MTHGHAPARWQDLRIGIVNGHCEHIVNTPVRIGTGSAREYLRTRAYVPARWQAVRIEQARTPARIGTVDTNPHTNPHGRIHG